MKPNEQYGQNEALPQLESQTIPETRFGEAYNGMYDNEAEFKEAEALYSLNTVSLEEPTAHPLATAEDASAWKDESITVESEDVPSTELSTESFDTITPTTETNVAETPESGAVESNDDVIEVEAKEVRVDPESLDETDDITELIEANDELVVGNEKLTFTPKLKQMARGVLTSLDELLSSSDAELPDEIDWRPYIISEPDYDYADKANHALIQRLMSAQYKRKRAKLIMRRTLDSARPISTTERKPADFTEVTPIPEPEAQMAKIENDGILKIEYDDPGKPDVPALEYEGDHPALPNETEATPGRSPG